MSIFRLPLVRMGKACPQTCRRGVYLFGGGTLDGNLIQIALGTEGERLRAAVCTAATVDRLGGIINRHGRRLSCGRALAPPIGFPHWPGRSAVNGDPAKWRALCGKASLAAAADMAPLRVLSLIHI